ncbi:ribonuclease H2 subunit A-like isoform X2 [Stegodyphus dumicola]|uniref:ribonuclease H2 subunit A-like isoform X2 n=1 Tax=Stegodyphus dumicola TaxID=202533 RepID=UPI0015A8DD5E|nr:ribonuclease H2 subunit A-like isoform X2 [Stegodyphus dumicola]
MDLIGFIENSSKNFVLESNVPTLAKTEPCMLGIDEAGRGPVLDSKTLTEEKRENLFSLIDEASDMMGWIIEIHSPNVISNCMLRRSKYNLNALSHDSAIMLIKKALDLGVNVTEVYVDTVGQPEKYQSKLSSIFPDLKITVAKQADATYPVVSAASICAKVARDNSLKSWKFAEGDSFQDIEYGSGYPNDPVTKKFLCNNIDPVFGFPQLVRFSWSTADKILQAQAVEVKWEEVDDENSPKKSQNLLKFMSDGSQTKTAMPKSHSFFTQRNLHQTSNL